MKIRICAFVLYGSVLFVSALTLSTVPKEEFTLRQCLTLNDVPAFSYYEPGQREFPVPPREFEPGAQITALDRAYLQIQDLVIDAYNGASDATLSAALDEILAGLPMDKDERDPLERLQLRCNPRTILRGLGAR